MTFTKHILGIDPGTHHTGWGVVLLQGSNLRHVDHGVIDAKGVSLATRLHTLAQNLERILQRFEPQHVAIESIFHHRNSQSALKLGHARGVVLLCAERFGACLSEYTPAAIKQAVAGNGRSEKPAVQRMVQLMLGIRGDMRLDASDALAAAICHAHRMPGEGNSLAARIKKAGAA